MTELWTAVDSYLVGALQPHDPALEGALNRSREAGLPEIAVAPNQGKLLHLLARIAGARRILEVGTLGGYSTIWLARALTAEGHLTTLEVDPKHAAVARANLDAAGVGERVEILVGPALDSLAGLDQAYDLVFIDADKTNNPAYVEQAIRLSHPGTVIVVDNTVRSGAVAEADSTDPAILATRRMFELLGDHPRIDATTVQTVGSKGHDGFTLALVT